jgi:hypothetical protein
MNEEPEMYRCTGRSRITPHPTPHLPVKAQYGLCYLAYPTQKSACGLYENVIKSPATKLVLNQLDKSNQEGSNLNLA